MAVGILFAEWRAASYSSWKAIAASKLAFSLTKSTKSLAHQRGSVWFWIALAGILLLLIALPYSSTFKNYAAKATDWAEAIMNAHPVTGAVVFFLFAALSAMLAFTSSVVLVPAANLVWGKQITFLLLWGGWVAGAVAAFGIGHVARPLLVRLGYQEKLKKYQQYVSRRMKFWTTFVFCMAVPSELPGYLLGGLHYPFLKFLVAIAIAEAIYAGGIVIAGQSLVAAKPLPFVIMIAALVAIAISARLLLRTLKKRRG
jgi:uncharacterized membrane protein YdjX (TVP38/TMEM64 family)